MSKRLRKRYLRHLRATMRLRSLISPPAYTVNDYELPDGTIYRVVVAPKGIPWSLADGL